MLCFAGGSLLGRRSLGGMATKAGLDGNNSHDSGHSNLRCFRGGVVGVAPKAAFAHYGRDSDVVLFVYACCGLAGVYALEVSLDTIIQHRYGAGVCMHQSFQA